MKLVIGGSTGFVATELIRQALEHPRITSIVALGRREILPSPDEGSKLRSIVCDDFKSYSDSVKRGLENADACIWYALTPYRPISVSPYLSFNASMSYHAPLML